MTEKNLTMKDTKEVILSAYQKAVSKLKDLEAGKLNPQAELKAKATTAVIASADEVSVGGVIESKIANLKKELGGLLDGMAGSISDQIKKYSDVQEAIKVKEQQLQELFGFEKEAFALVAIVNAKEEVLRKHDEDFAAKKADAENVLETIRKVAQDERNNIQKELAETRANIDKERKREEEDYKYNTKRTRKQEEDKFQDELDAKKREFNEQCESFTKKLNAQEASVIEREQEVAFREEKVADLEDKILELQADKATAIEEAVKQAKSEANSAFYREKSYIEREAKHAVELAESKVASLEASLNKANETIDTLNSKLEKAYQELRDLAKSTVDNAGNQKVISQLERMVQGQSQVTK